MKLRNAETVNKLSQIQPAENGWEYPKEYIEILQKVGQWPIRHEDVSLDTQTLNDHNIKFAELGYELKAGDFLKVRGGKVSMEGFSLYAIKEMRWFMQPAFHLVYRHMSSGKMVEVVANYELAESDIDGNQYGEMYDIEARVMPDGENLEQTYFILRNDFMAAKRRYRVSQVMDL